MKKKKHLKIFAAGGLALFMGLGTLCGVLISPMNLLHAGATSASNVGDLAASAQSPDRAIALNPETDEVIYKAESGLEIKRHNATATGTATSIQYFTLGSYNGTPVNWLIVGFGAGCAPDTTPAGSAIIANHANQKFVAGATSTSLATNQVLCVSQYAFNQESFNANFVAHANATKIFSDYPYTFAEDYSALTDNFTDYHNGNFAALSTYITNALTLGTTLGINGYYGNGSGKIVKNSNFSSNYVFSLKESHYTTFVGSTNYKIPYLFTANSTPVNLWVGDVAYSNTVTSTTSYTRYYAHQGMQYHVTGSGAANSKITYINSSGNSASHTIMSATGTTSEPKSFYDTTKGHVSSGSIGTYSNAYFDYTVTYTVTNNPISLAYRPAFILQL